MVPPLPTVGIWAIKKLLPHILGQEQNSCDTTRIDEKSSTRFTHHHTRPIGNGRVPVGHYLDLHPFRPPSKDHSSGSDCRNCTACDSLKIRVRGLLFFLISLCAHSIHNSPICKPANCTNFVLLFRRKYSRFAAAALAASAKYPGLAAGCLLYKRGAFGYTLLYYFTELECLD